jgi:hypothetical protein
MGWRYVMRSGCMSDTKTQHTPGPWYVWPTHWDGGSNSVAWAGQNTVWIDSPRGELAMIKPNGRRIDDLVYADARLIAAAPDLLEALKAARAGRSSIEDVPLHEQIDAAITKATVTSL